MVGTAKNFLRFNTDGVMICSFCHKPTNKLTTHHIIPRFLSISSDEDTMEICTSCHRHLDQLWHTFILWGDFNPVGWTNPVKDKVRRKEYEKKNHEKILAYQRDWHMARRRALGVPTRPINIKRRYDDLEIFKKQLSYLYWEKNLGWRGVAEEMKLSTSCIMKWQRLLGIPSRPRPIAVHLACERRKMQW